MSDEHYDDTERGLYRKFTVQHAREKVQGDDLFVLDLDHDPFAPQAQLAYWTALTPMQEDWPRQDGYYVRRVDGSTKHQNCQFFVLNFSKQHDRSLEAIRVYHQQCKTQYPALAAEIWGKWIGPADNGD